MQRKLCAGCELADGTQRCSVCKAVNYCSKDCQTKHWTEHKRTCTPPIAGPPTAAEVEAKRTRFVEAQAQEGPTRLQAPWAFKHRGYVIVNDRPDEQAKAGDVAYALPWFEFGPAIEICGWVFVLERNTAEARPVLNPLAKENYWYLCAFHGNYHYTFERLLDAPDLVKVLLGAAVPRFWPILHPEAFVGARPDSGGMVQVKWTTAPLEPPKTAPAC